MTARADAVAQTREQILQAGMALSQEKLSFAIALADVATRAGVTARTVLRHFGSRDQLFEALLSFARDQVIEERETPVGDTVQAARTIVAHYEHKGDRVMRMLEESSMDERIAAHVAEGRRLHRSWVRTVFAPQLARAGDAKALEDLLVVATDVYTWKLLRRDAGLSRARTEERMHTLIRCLVGEET
ncbi:MAG: TetR/AcrR family transcriptional regulator [Acidimicrobiia bacterium]